MKQYACASVTGYKDVLETQTIKLPLKYRDSDVSNTKINANEHFNKLISNTGHVVELSEYKTFVDLVAIDITNDVQKICLTPIVFNDSLQLPLQRLEILLPNKLISNRCYSVTIDPSNSDSQELNLVVDFLDDRYLLSTIMINLNDFLMNQGNKFSLHNFDQWGNISVPYSFELRSSPFYMKFLDVSNCIVSLKDGGLLHFVRASPLSDFDTYNFNEQTKLSFNLFGSLFNGTSAQKGPNGNFSNNCVVDLLIVNDMLITLTVNKLLKFWDISTHNLAKLMEISTSTNNYLTTIPSKYLYKLIQNDRTYIVFHNTNLFEIDQGAEFKLFEVDKYYTDITMKSFTIQLPKFGDEYRNKIWYIQDFHIDNWNENNQDDIKLYVLWKSNISSLLINYIVDIKEFVIKIVEESEIDRTDECLQDYDQGFYFNQIMNTGIYDRLTLQTSVNILRERLGLPAVSGGKDYQDLPIIDTIKALTDQQGDRNTEQVAGVNSDSSNHQDPWFILNSLCDEYKNLSKESLNLCLFRSNIILLQANGLGIYRPLSYFEQFEDDLTDSFSQYLHQISIKLSNKTIYKVYQHVMSLKQIESSQLLYISETLLSSKFADDMNHISEVLNNYPNILDKIDNLINGQPVDLLVGYEGTVSAITKNFIIVSFKDLIQKHKQLLLRLLILFSNFEEEPNLLSFSNSILNKLDTFNTLEILFGKDYGASIIWEQLMIRGDIINKYNYIHTKMNHEEYIVNIIVALVRHGQYRLIMDEFLPRISKSNTSKEFLFLKGLVQLMNKNTDGIELLSFPNFQEFVTKFRTHKFTKEINQFLGHNEINNNESKYYHHLSEFILKIPETFSSEFMQASIDLELKAISLSQNKEEIELYYENIFQNSIKLFNIEIILQSLQNLQSSIRFRTYLKYFITKLIEHDSINKLFTKDEAFLKSNFKIIDIILIELASNESLLDSIKFYEILYSWRINHHLIRQGIEALYWFIIRFETEVGSKHEENDGAIVSKSNLKIIYLKILEFYLIILNCLKSFSDNSDKWLIKYVPDNNQLITLQELNVEYLNYLKRLNNL